MGTLLRQNVPEVGKSFGKMLWAERKKGPVVLEQQGEIFRSLGGVRGGGPER